LPATAPVATPVWLRPEMILSSCCRFPGKALRKVGAGSALLLLFFAPAPSGWSAGAGGAGPDVARLGTKLREILLGDPGRPILCPGCPSEPAVRVDVASGLVTEVPLPYQQVHSIALFADGKRILAATSSEKGRRGLLLVLSAESLAPLGRVEIPGNGVRIAIAPDGYSAYVLCHRPGKSLTAEPGDGSWELVVADLGASAVTEAYPLPGAARDLALAPGGGRLFVAMKDRVQSFTTGPLTASWYYRSPGDNRLLFVRPGWGEVYLLRGPAIAIFDPEPKGRSGESPAGEADDAAGVLETPAHVDRIGFSKDGRLAVAAGKGIDALLVLDTERRRFVGTWPEDAAAIGALLETMAAEGKPRGPRGKMAPSASRFDPPLGLPPKPGPPLPSQAAPQPRMSSPSPQPKEAPGGASGQAPAAPSPATDSPAPSAIEEVAEPELSGKITGEYGRVASVILFGPDSLTTVQDQVTPGPDGGFSFALPPRGRYRIVPLGTPGTTLSCRPPFLVVEVGAYGFRGLDFRVLGVLGIPAPKRP